MRKKLLSSIIVTAMTFAMVACGGAEAETPVEQAAVEEAADYTAECIRLTLEDPAKPWYGVNFEQAIPFLIKRIGK